MNEIPKEILEALRQLKTRKTVKTLPGPPRNSQVGEDELVSYPTRDGYGMAIKIGGQIRELASVEGNGSVATYAGGSRVVYSKPGWSEIERLDRLIADLTRRLNALLNETYEIAPVVLDLGAIQGGAGSSSSGAFSIKNWDTRTISLAVSQLTADTVEFSIDNSTWASSLSAIEIYPMTWTGDNIGTVYCRAKTPKAPGNYSTTVRFIVSLSGVDVATIDRTAVYTVGIAADISVTPHKVLHVNGPAGDGIDGVPTGAEYDPIALQTSWPTVTGTDYICITNSGDDDIRTTMTLWDDYYADYGDSADGPWLSVITGTVGVDAALNYLKTTDADLAGGTVTVHAISTDTDGNTTVDYTLGNHTKLYLFPVCIPLHEGLGLGIVEENRLALDLGFSSPYDDYQIIVEPTWDGSRLETFAFEESFGQLQVGQTKDHPLVVRNRSATRTVECRLYFDTTYDNHPSGPDATQFTANTGDGIAEGWSATTFPQPGWYCSLDPKGDKAGDDVDILNIRFEPDSHFPYHEEAVTLQVRYDGELWTDPGIETYTFVVNGTGIAEGPLVVPQDGSIHEYDSANGYYLANADWPYCDWDPDTPPAGDTNGSYTIHNLGSEDTSNGVYIVLPYDYHTEDYYLNFKWSQLEFYEADGVTPYAAWVLGGSATDIRVGTNVVSGAGWYYAGPFNIKAGGRVVMKVATDVSEMTPGYNEVQCYIFYNESDDTATTDPAFTDLLDGAPDTGLWDPTDLYCITDFRGWRQNSDANIVFEIKTGESPDVWEEVTAADLGIVRISDNYTDIMQWGYQTSWGVANGDGDEIGAVRITNTGEDDAHDLNLATISEDSAFTLNQTTNYGADLVNFDLDAGESTDPTTPGERVCVELNDDNLSIDPGVEMNLHTGSLRVLSQPGDGVALTGRSGRFFSIAGLDPDSPEIDFGQVVRGGKAQIPVTITNLTSEAITFAISVDGDDLSTDGLPHPGLYVTDFEGDKTGYRETGATLGLGAGLSATWIFSMEPDFDDSERPLEVWSAHADIVPNIAGEGVENTITINMYGMVAADQLWGRPEPAAVNIPTTDPKETGARHVDFVNKSGDVHSLEPAVLPGDTYGTVIIEPGAIAVSPGGRGTAYFRVTHPAHAAHNESVNDRDPYDPEESQLGGSVGNTLYPLHVVSAITGNSGVSPAIISADFIRNTGTGDNDYISTIGTNHIGTDLGRVPASSFFEAWKRRILVGIINQNASPLSLDIYGYAQDEDGFTPETQPYPLFFIPGKRDSLGDIEATPNPNDDWPTETCDTNNPSTWSTGATAFVDINSIPVGRICYFWVVPWCQNDTYTDAGYDGTSIICSLVTVLPVEGFLPSFRVEYTTPLAESASVIYPSANSVLTKNSTVQVTWTDTHYDHYNDMHIVLSQDGVDSTIVSSGVYNTGYWTWETLDKGASHSYSTDSVDTLFTIKITHNGADEFESAPFKIVE